MKRIALVLTFVFALSTGITAEAAVKAGAACTKAGATSTVSNKKFTCVKSGKKLVWDKGVAVKKPVVVVPELPRVEPTTAASPTPTPTATPTQDPNIPKQGQVCTPKSEDVIGFNKYGEYVDLMCNEFDNTYFPRPANLNPFKVNPQTGEKLKNAMQETMQTIEWKDPKIVSTLPSSTISSRSELLDISKCKIPDAGVAGAMPNNEQHHFVSGFSPYPERAPLTRNPVIQFVTVDFPDLQGQRSPKEDLKEVTDFITKYWNSQISNNVKVEIRMPEKFIRMPKNVVDYKMNVDFFSGQWSANNAFDYVREAIRIADPQINFSGADIMVIAVPSQVTREQIGAFIAESSEARFPDSGFQTNEKKMMNTLVMAGPSSTKAGELLNWAHELGHNFGLTDLRNTMNVAQQDSSDLGIYDLMNSSLAPELLGWNRYILGVMNDSQVRCVGGGITTHLIRPIEMPTTEEKLVVIPTGTYQGIAIESRRAIGFDATLGYSSEGVIVYTIDSTIPYHLSSMKLVPRVGSKDDQWRRDAALQVGDSVTVNGWKISVIESGDFGDVVKVEKAS